MKFSYLSYFLFIYCTAIFAQGGFQIKGSKKIKIPFQQLNNLIIIPVVLNNVNLNFLLDTGVDKTILFSIEDRDSVKFNNVEKIQIKGLGNGLPVDAFLAKKNKLSISKFEDDSHEIYIVLDQDINFSTQLGIPVHGIIGNAFFKNHFVEINYENKKIVVYRSRDNFSMKKIKKFKEIPISITLGKPYTNAIIKIDSVFIKTKLLIDTGGSDAIWLFENTIGIQSPKENFKDFLGRGFSGDIIGKRSRLKEFHLNEFTFISPTVSFPDSLSIVGINMVNGRNGSIGGGLLKRFNILMDYSNNKMFIKKNSKFKLPFNYDMSGLEIQHSGVQWVKEEVSLQTSLGKNENQVFGEGLSTIKYNFALKPIYDITNVRNNSPAQASGLLKGDKISKINGQPAFRYNLQEIVEILQSQENSTINIEVVRKNKSLNFEFKLRKVL